MPTAPTGRCSGARLATLRSDATRAEQDAAVRDLVVDRSRVRCLGGPLPRPPRAEASVDAERAARMNRVNPKYVLRNHLAETAIRKARGDEAPRDFSEIDRLLAVLVAALRRAARARGVRGGAPRVGAVAAPVVFILRRCR